MSPEEVSSSDLCRTCLPRMSALRVPKRLYKFTKAEYALLALEQRQVKISTIDDLNDLFDLCSVDMATATGPGVWKCHMFTSSPGQLTSQCETLLPSAPTIRQGQPSRRVVAAAS